MTNGNPAAEAIAAIHMPVRKIAVELGVHVSTVYRWRAGGNPSAANLAKLRNLAAQQLGTAAQGERERAAASRAVEALETADRKAELEQLRTSIAATMAAARREPVVSIAARVNPFDLITPDPLGAALDAAFGEAA